jgi:hypothetical protein
VELSGDRCDRGGRSVSERVVTIVIEGIPSVTG